MCVHPAPCTYQKAMQLIIRLKKHTFYELHFIRNKFCKISIFELQITTHFLNCPGKMFTQNIAQLLQTMTIAVNLFRLSVTIKIIQP